MVLETLIAKYGYLAIGIGTFFEGEIIVILGSLAAHSGYLDLSWVIVCAFLGTLLGDQFYFHLGRIIGKGALERRPRWKAKSEKVFALLEKHQVWLILGFRFVYGIRTATPFIIGASRVSPVKFLILNGIGAAACAIAVGILGYLFGYAIEFVIGDIKKYELLVFAAIAGIGIIIWLVRLWRKSATRRRDLMSNQQEK